ncbi:MAG TPA: 2-phospho-L-lactate transferase [Brevefilum fermentans]|uniref:2-phospho-L-lactate transferase n=1 Tax=Candidatus Brevifilum fermentans TaxID=1986204 RepID=A0A1Y6K303_9CHLR|nr:2-phospho-L-lactate transferase [Brevefilum fermentans]MDI9566910.1 2-phospho-L-lactate transferase [Chloroflexota bacterium]OQB87906.1 MAG: 2-phospho-L-lactate transferase [Chloroflexi bacterium ADurb.Bin120]SMX54092.1 2-phospho-L-lactate transferase [Brevefilum fermentans]HOM67717.1 2-phospho-L-lactate transferase [Brevefilum fermentans]HPX96004.1 2-phospho-L-lactate transferase [Brevefilum fermentans]
MKVVALTGGVGGAKLVYGLAALLSPEELSVIVNTGDDFDCWGLRVCPDLDTVCYTLAGLANPKTGWGQQDETWEILKKVRSLGGSTWFKIGDNDLATHLRRTELLSEGETLSSVTQKLCSIWGVKHQILPMSDDPIRTIVHTAEHGELAFQRYFVQLACQPVVRAFEFCGAEVASPAPGALALIDKADVVILTPSNPFVSIDPILAIPGYRQAIEKKPVVGISPLVGGKAVKGPAAKMFHELGIVPSASAVAGHYQGLLRGFVFDTQDQTELEKIERWRIIPLITNTIMRDAQDRIRLAEEVIKFCELVLTRSL